MAYRVAGLPGDRDILPVDPAPPASRDTHARSGIPRLIIPFADAEQRSKRGESGQAATLPRTPARAAAPRRLPWDDPYAATPPPMLLYSSQFAAQQLAQEAIPEDLAEAPQHRLAGLAAYRSHLPEDVAIVGPAAAIGHVI